MHGLLRGVGPTFWIVPVDMSFSKLTTVSYNFRITLSIAERKDMERRYL